MGDFVLISHERWPHKKLAKIASRWFGPFCVTGVKANTLEVAAGPSNGGQIQVSYEQCKHWNTILDHNEELDHDDDDTMMIDDDDPDDLDITEITQNEPPTESTSSTQVTSSNGAKNGNPNENPSDFYIVEKIHKHKWINGWTFLTSWEGFPSQAQHGNH